MDDVVTEHMKKGTRPRNHLRHHYPISQTPSSTRCKSTISSLFLSTFSTTNETTSHSSDQNRKKKNNNNNNSNSSASTKFRGLGCTAGASSQHVSVPDVIRSSADWQGKKKKKKKKKNHRRRNSKTCHHHGSSSSAATIVDFEDVWCGPGIGFLASDAAAASAASVNCVVVRKNVSSSRGKLDAERVTHRERPVYSGRRAVNTEGFSFLNDDPGVFTARPVESESFVAGRYFRHIPHPSSGGLAEIMKLQERLLMRGTLTSRDQFSEWRLDVDRMTYEQLLELGERIGCVNTGLKEDEMRLTIKKIKHVISDDASKKQIDKKCIICQEEYEADDELGRLNCEHNYHFQCIKQWLLHKNFCPVCKQEVVVRH